ncbi:Aminotransferase class-III OS=Tsukamurella paurometabola (strain ATCC 8368 / DSM / CCUG 35730/ CIP 100753 / JCM 10117 / KCTC 9821 / NBRC 16120 / NCIMB 702349 / NCTC 13040) OX=521096 GN=Tpau_0071 PE=4 SV=1 [Tsukamurella paurometabola]|uniref:Aminotransferase class-III n=1 Tax=Tsukamurella paurometabola (strain ATCC 8368 / DSM 20162 / CCUG 35730 / CIP 100753 / JCM 10117 / KCTC 9821 / NBRC 16120 / NCIMB 702349 / NCTC 13040) TaxID=521096 RepID=D5UPV7_TSUPD|nr:aminotransferase class-III [Tsukamurella paurometabola DSM 20162]SUP41368.1 Glutamate-1-semialdehyde 2,1-aminomutase [Tsukamurella paurometabola]
MACRGCGSGDLHRVLDLGAVPAADHFPPAESPVTQEESAHPLAMDLCGACGLAQLAADDTVTDEPRGVEPQALKDQAADAVARAASAGWLNGKTVREFGSPHGGTWLPLLAERGLQPTEGPADVVVDCFGVMHEPDQKAAFARRAAALAPGGVLLLQYHALGAIVAGEQWNALRHGHFAYYSLHALSGLLAGAGLSVAGAWEFDLYGGTVMLAVVEGSVAPDDTVFRLLDEEERAGLRDPAVVGTLGRAALRQAAALRAWAHDETAAGRRPAAYGAASRAVALFALAGLNRAVLSAVADASPGKQGRRMPGTDIPIVAPEVVAAGTGPVLLTLPDLRDELVAGYPALSDRLVVDPSTVVTSPVALEPDDGPPPRDFTESNRLQARLHQLVPGGAHTYARASDQYPENMAPILTGGLGARVQDVDGNEYVEYGMGLRAVTLGHAHPRVVAAVTDAIAHGTNFSRPTALEVDAAEDFLALVPGADMVKFAKNGSDATTAAVRLARAATGRDLVAACDHPFFSVDDWFIGTTAMNAGIPAEVPAKTLRFQYNDPGSLQRLFDENPGRIACVFLEAATATAEPVDGFLERVRTLCDRNGALLVFDEMITGFRWSEHGAQGLYGVIPDLSCWGKAMGNGLPMAALAGRREYMELGGLNTDRDRVFLLSTTHGPETAGLAAFRAVVAEYAESDPIGAMEAAGRRLERAATEVIAGAGLADYVQVIGRPSCQVFVTRDAEGAPSQAYRTLFLQGLLENGVLAQSLVNSAAHTEADVDHTVDAIEEALVAYGRAVVDGTVEGHLRGRPVAPALRRSAAPRRLPDA